ncbi:unnamed protein product [Adineta steineri]|uniref:Uncharacterized protein n=1 Tax=Adineta steineri TaxID=433720 RepID=A0A814XU53_9BILA|nr:unnamed protein product [Adineta steineri]CAF1157508.1 unnamed protein product [Adineta steineri]CAF1220456.1 unnamed protein product [Adineta steineri]
MVDVLYSLVDVTQRFDQLIFDPFYIHNLDMTSMMMMKSFYNWIYSIEDKVLDRICKNILPRVHYQINELIIEQNSLERVLHTIDYPQLYSLLLMDLTEEVLLKYLTVEDNTTLRRLLSEQITCLKLVFKYDTTLSISGTSSIIFALILSLCKRLVKLNFYEFFERSIICTFEISSMNCTSSTLTELVIDIKTFDDCLYLLDGRLNCLSKLIIYILEIANTIGTIDNTKKLSKLKYFSLMSYRRTVCYDNLIIPLLRRMINLEELILFLSIITEKNYIDGIQLYDSILIYMPRLNKFSFSIDTYIAEHNIEFALSSNEDIQRSFIRKEYGSVYSQVEIFPREYKRRCTSWSLPYRFESGLFNNVQSLIMADFRPFEHGFFKIISQSFPLLKKLYILNDEPQKHKQQPRKCIIFSHLVLLFLHRAHVDYAEQFLSEKYCYLPSLLDLSVGYKSLALVTNNFTNDETRVSCSKLTALHIKEPFVLPINFHEYFPLL